MLTKQRVCVVTEGAHGIGAVMSRLLAEEGYIVIAHYNQNHEESLSFGKTFNIPTFSWDHADENQCRYNLDSIKNKYGPIDILVHNSNLESDAPCHKMDAMVWETVIRTNLTSCFYLTQPLLPSMKERKFGRLIFISSISAEKGQQNQANYCASKAGIIGFMKCLALEGASKGITSNAISPGYIEVEDKNSVNPNPLLSMIPLNRAGTPQDIARCVLFLASDFSSYITGETLHVNGGQYMA